MCGWTRLETTWSKEQLKPDSESAGLRGGPNAELLFKFDQIWGPIFSLHMRTKRLG